MRYLTHSKRLRTGCVVAVLAAFFLPPVWAAEEGIVGDWQLSMDFNGQQRMSSLSIVKKADGTLAGSWGSSALSNVKFDGQKLTFTRTLSFGDQEFTMDFSGTLKDGKLTGTLSSDRGDTPITGMRKKPKSPALGQWDITFNVQGQDITARLIVGQKPDGTLRADWTSESGEHKISNVMFRTAS